MKEKKIRYYKNFSDDFVKSGDQDYVLPEGYQWVRTDFCYRILSALIYALAVAFSSIYCKFFLHMKVKGRNRLRGIKGGFFLYGNHTQPVGDVFIPALCVFPRRIYTVAGTANYGIPVIGRILPYLGALPTVDSLRGMKELSRAIAFRVNSGHPVVIYPEAHVWEYYTDIRPFPVTSFKYPVKLGRPSFAMTVTYRKARLFRRPIMEVFLDGPFYGRGSTAKEQAEDLHSKIFAAMKSRSRNSNAERIVYRPES